jgi:hypothetical protein
MGVYLDRLTEQFDEITGGIDEILNRAAEENREINDEESKLVERDSKRAEGLRASIDHYAAIETTRAKVSDIRAKVPTTTVSRATTVVNEAAPPLTDLFPTAGDYIVTVGRALRGDKAAGELIERARSIVERDTTTKHQTTADNPGIIPRVVLGPVISLVGSARPFISSISNKPLPSGAFDRPQITQHVAIGKQVAEKSRTESEKLLLGKIPVTASTYAGHLNVSRQDVKWTQPGIMQILAEDFAYVYAMTTDEDAVAQFVASVAGNVPVVVPSLTPADIRAALFSAATAPFASGNPAALPDTLWLSADVWSAIGGIVTPNGVPAFPNLSPGAISTGDIGGFKPVVDPFFPPGTAILGKGSLAEWYEDVDGLLEVSEPDVLGQLVGYAGYGAFVNTAPEVFTVLELPPPAPLAAASSSAKAKG